MAVSMSEKDFYFVSLKGIIKNKEGRILGLKGVEQGTFAGFYDLPGGRIDVGEFETPFMEILEREIREEVGPDVKFTLHETPVALGRHKIAPKHSGKVNRELHVLYVFFLVDYLGGDIKISEEHSDYAWIDCNVATASKYFTSGILEGIQVYLSSPK